MIPTPIRNIFRAEYHRELVWILPFLCVALMVTSLLRPQRQFSAPTHNRVVIDGAGVKVAIEEPFRGVVFTWGAWGVGGYLANTRAPQTVLNAGGPEDREWFGKHDIMSKVYPQVLNDDRYWDPDNGDWAQRAKSEIEGLMRYNAGAYLGNGGEMGMVPILRSVGLPALNLLWTQRDLTKNWDDACYLSARVESTLTEQPQAGEALIARYKQAFADIKSELRPETLPHQPRVLMMGSSWEDRGYFYLKSVKNSYQIYFPPAGIINASEGLTGDREDAERILAMDPDMIYLTGSRDSWWPTEDPQQFLRDPRWRGLKAVQTRRVYRVPGGGGLGGLLFQPIYNRWMAEMAHPDRMQPRVRQLLRDRFITEFNYRLSEDQIDEILNVDENGGLPGAERFTRGYSGTLSFRELAK
jgi:iron complex transport system substrate-binding protein